MWDPEIIAMKQRALMSQVYGMYKKIIQYYKTFYSKIKDPAFGLIY